MEALSIDDMKPLLLLFSGNGRFCLPTLSRKQVRLFLGSHYSVKRCRCCGAAIFRH